MLEEYYVFSNESDAIACIDAINSTDWFPAVGTFRGKPAPDKQLTTCWCTEAKELKTGEFAVPRIPKKALDALNVPQSDRDAFLLVYGQDIRTLDISDF